MIWCCYIKHVSQLNYTLIIETNFKYVFNHAVSVCNITSYWVNMSVTGSKWPKWGQNGPSTLDTYLMYLFEERAIRNGYLICDN